MKYALMIGTALLALSLPASAAETRVGKEYVCDEYRTQAEWLFGKCSKRDGADSESNAKAATKSSSDIPGKPDDDDDDDNGHGNDDDHDDDSNPGNGGGNNNGNNGHGNDEDGNDDSNPGNSNDDDDNTDDDGTSGNSGNNNGNGKK